MDKYERKLEKYKIDFNLVKSTFLAILSFTIVLAVTALSLNSEDFEQIKQSLSAMLLLLFIFLAITGIRTLKSYRKIENHLR